jgi:hypothetical protein
MTKSKAEKCAAIWAKMPQATAIEVAAAYEKEYGEKCSPVTARKVRPGSQDDAASRGPITAAELRRVKEIAQKNGGLTALAKEVMLVAKLGEEFGGVARLAEAVQEYADLVGGKD